MEKKHAQLLRHEKKTIKEIEALLESVNDDDTVYCSIDDLRAQVYYRRVVTHELVKRFRNK